MNYLDITVNDASFRKCMEIQQAPSTIYCNFKSLGPRQNLIFICYVMQYYMIIKRKCDEIEVTQF